MQEISHEEQVFFYPSDVTGSFFEWNSLESINSEILYNQDGYSFKSHEEVPLGIAVTQNVEDTFKEHIMFFLEMNSKQNVFCCCCFISI